MYRIYADNTIIYDSEAEDYVIASGVINLEVNKSGSFAFSIYPDHFYYDDFVKLKTIIKVTRSDEIIFRGRILNTTTDYWNNKVITCEGELGFLQDSLIWRYNFQGTPEDLFKKYINEHNSRVEAFKQFTIGSITVTDPNNYINRSNENVESALNNMTTRLIEDSLGGYFYIDHGPHSATEKPTINYLADFTHISTQNIEFGENLKDYVKTVKADDVATVLIPLGAVINTETNARLDITSVNSGKGYIENTEGITQYGKIWRCEILDDVTDANNLLTKGRARLNEIVNQAITIELTAIDLHLIDRNIEAFHVGDYIPVISEPHNFNSTMLCTKQTIDLLHPDNDTLTLGRSYSSFTDVTSKSNLRVKSMRYDYTEVNGRVNTVASDVTAVASAVVDTNRSLSSHEGNNENPHNVNAQQIGAVGASSAGDRIESGTATINFYTSTTSAVSVNFTEAFSTPPRVIVQQVFDSYNITVPVAEITASGFKAHVPAIGSNGSRAFTWIAYGK